MTIMVFVIVCVQFGVGLIRMVNRDNPDYSGFFLTQVRGPYEALNVPELGGQMYIGIREVTEARNGTVTAPFIAFDERYINSKMVHYENNELLKRVNLPACEDRADFVAKANMTSGLSADDFDMLKCIPAEEFSLYNDAGSNLFNSITLLFEQCGGKYSGEVDLTD